MEFGAGGSTCLAAHLVSEAIVAVDSSKEWLNKVEESCARNATALQPTLIHADIGELTHWGWPAGQTHREHWPKYHEAVLSAPDVLPFDTYLIDGRFRIACFMQSLIHCRPDSLILIHDFPPRPSYAIVHQVAREIACATNLSIFIRSEKFDLTLATKILSTHKFAPR